MARTPETPKRRNTVRPYSRIVERLVITIRGRKVSNIEHFSQRTESLNKGGMSRVAFAELNQKGIGEFYEQICIRVGCLRFTRRCGTG
jgi:hypothetical protein